MSTYDKERHINISLDIEGMGMDGYIGEIIFNECLELVEKRKITLEDLERFKLNVSSYYSNSMSEEGISGVLETYIVDTMEEIVRGDYN